MYINQNIVQIKFNSSIRDFLFNLSLSFLSLSLQAFSILCFSLRYKVSEPSSTIQVEGFSIISLKVLTNFHGIRAMDSTTSSPSPLTFNTMVHMITIKLSSTNYLLWKSQFLPLLRSQGLLGYVDGSAT